MQNGEMVAFDTDMVGPYGYCADISRAYVVGHKFNEEQKKLYSMATDQIDHNARLIKPGMSFKEFVSKSWVLPQDYYGNRYSCMVLQVIGLVIIILFPKIVLWLPTVLYEIGRASCRERV